MRFEWNSEKNSILKAERGISFEAIVSQIESRHLWKIEEHFNKEKFPNQWILYVELNDYIYLVPFVTDGEVFFLKTIYPDRKSTKKYHEERNK